MRHGSSNSQSLGHLKIDLKKTFLINYDDVVVRSMGITSASLFLPLSPLRNPFAFAAGIDAEFLASFDAANDVRVELSFIFFYFYFIIGMFEFSHFNFWYFRVYTTFGLTACMCVCVCEYGCMSKLKLTKMVPKTMVL